MLICKPRGAFNDPKLCSQSCNPPTKGGEESSVTRGWLSGYQHKMLPGSKRKGCIQRATKSCRGMSPSYGGCVSMSNYTVSSLLWLGVENSGEDTLAVAHSWDREDKPCARLGSCTSEAQGEGGNPVQPLPRLSPAPWWEHRARCPARGGRRGSRELAGSTAPLARRVQRESAL